MLNCAVIFLCVATIAAIFGFGGIATGLMGLAKALFFVSVLIAVVLFLLSLYTQRP